jgi:methyl-accepting chemotaxis protein
MEWINNISIKKKLFISFIIVTLISGAIGYVGYSGITKVNKNQEDMYSNKMLAIQELAEIKMGVLTIRGDIRAASTSGSQAEREKYYASIQSNLDKVDETYNQYLKIKLTALEEREIKNYEDNWQQYKSGKDKFIQLLNNNNIQEARSFMESFLVDKMLGMRKSLDILFKENIDQAAALDNKSDDEAASGKSLLLIFTLLGAAAAIGFGYVIAGSISKPLHAMQEGANAIADGNLSYSSPYLRKQAIADNEIGWAIKAVIKMKDVIVEKSLWYEQILDAIPFPLSVTDKNMNWTFVNKPVETMLNTKRENVIGKPCSNWGSAICKTENCGIACLGKGKTQTHFDQGGGNFKVDSAYLYNSKGEMNGHVEVVQDITQIKSLENYLGSKAAEMLVEMDKLAAGDLTVSLKIEKDDQIGKLFTGFNTTVNNISTLITRVSEAVHATASASAQISSSSEEMAAGAQESSAQTTEIAGAAEEMTKTVYETSKNASIAAENSKLASQNAHKGTQKVLETKKGMERIVASTNETGRIITSLAQKTDQIGEIAQVIDDIADQTNLLALNAAIEAARAGEQGRGFAVVADEVRKLAERTTKATKEIADTIKSIQNEAKEADKSMVVAGESVQDGMQLTAQVADVLNEILEDNSKVADMINQVAAASEQQSSTAEQISRNIEGISSVTQESAAGTQQIARAAEDLNQLTTNLQGLITQFRTESLGSYSPQLKAQRYAAISN